MELTPRKQKILESLIEEYVKLAEPVSSSLLKKKHRFDISPATIRNEMKELTDEGYLSQPHTSAGRIPTDKSYRFFVDRLIEEGIKDEEKVLENFKKIREGIEDTHRFVRLLTKRLAHLSSALAMCYLREEELFLREGWNEIFKAPEFKNFGYSSQFINAVENIEEKLGKFSIKGKLCIYIGEEFPFAKNPDISMILSECDFPELHEGLLAILGPKRMPYQKNISLLASVVKLLEEK